MKSEVKKALQTLEAATANCQVGDRHIVVLDRGWIFVGDLSQDDDTGVYTLSNCHNVRKWAKGGFGLLSQDASAAGAVLDKAATLRFRSRALLFAVPVAREWGNA